MLIENFKLENWINENTSRIKYDLSETCVGTLTLAELSQICDCDLNDLYNIKLGYGQIHGSEALKHAICKLYNNCHPDEISITLGGIGANNLALKTVVNKGDKVVCILPCYQQSYSLPKFYGANVELFFLNPQDWSIDREKLKEAVGNDTKLICLTSPNNPTGIVINENDAKFIVETARSCGAYIFADEVYRGLNHFGNPYSFSFADLYEKSIVTGSMSKAYSLAGIRLGWIVSNSEFIKKVNLNREYNTISISAIDDYIASIALNNHQKIIQRNLKIIQTGKQIVSDFIEDNKMFSWVEPNSATIGCIKYDFPLDSEEFCAKLLKDTGVLVIPASVFECEKFFRIGYAMDENILRTALKELSEWIN